MRWLIHQSSCIKLLILSNNQNCYFDGEHTHTLNNPNAMSRVLLLFWCFFFSLFWVTILNDDIYQVNWRIHSFGFFFLYMCSALYGLICIYLSHVHVTRPVSVSCSINIDIELCQISSLTFSGRMNDFVRRVIIVWYNSTIIILFV